MLTRRAFLGGSIAAAASAACRRGPAIVTSKTLITHGVQSGDVQSGRAVVWARCNEPARMLVEWRTSRSARWNRVAGPLVNGESDFAGHAVIDRLPDGQTIEYRIAFEREAARGVSA